MIFYPLYIDTTAKIEWGTLIHNRSDEENRKGHRVPVRIVSESIDASREIGYDHSTPAIIGERITVSIFVPTGWIDVVTTNDRERALEIACDILYPYATENDRMEGIHAYDVTYLHNDPAEPPLTSR